MNDPFIPLHYMVYSLKFDMAHCKSFSSFFIFSRYFPGPWSNKKCDLKIEEGPSPGQIVVNGKIVQVKYFSVLKIQ